MYTSVNVGNPDFAEEGGISVHVGAVGKSLEVGTDLQSLIHPVNPQVELHAQLLKIKRRKNYIHYIYTECEYRRKSSLQLKHDITISRKKCIAPEKIIYNYFIAFHWTSK